MKTYLRYQVEQTTGTVASAKSNSLIVERQRSLLALTPAYDSVLVWDVMRAAQVFRFQQGKETDGEVTCLATDQATNLLAVGRMKGKVDLYDFSQMQSKEAKPRVSLSGHRSHVTCAVFSPDSSRMATGSRDTFIILWDVIGEVGLFRLNGHRDEVTCLRFSTPAILVSSSKDTTMKMWDLNSQHCDKTIADHAQSVWGFDLEQSGAMYTGSSDGLLRSFQSENGQPLQGSVNRQAASERCESVAVHNGILALQSASRVEFYRIRTEDQAAKKQKRRVRRMRERKEVDDDSMWTSDRLELACVLRSPHRIRSVSLCGDRVLISYTNNLVEVYVLTTVADDEDEDAPAKKSKVVSHLEILTRFELQGHRTDVRALALGDSDELVMSAADGACKVWSVESGACLRTIKTGFALCVAFVPNTTLAVVGTREGTLQVCNYQNGQTVRDFANSHGENNAVYSLDIRSDGKGMVTCGGDKTCKFWDFKFSPSFSLQHTRTLRFENADFQCVRYTKGPSSREVKVCVAMLDNTVKIFHEDSLAFALSLYGHKLPVLSMDCSDDGTLLATASADKTIKIWGMDFGDCHSSMFAHEGSVTCCKFVSKTHYLVSCGRDGKVRYWDVDGGMKRILSFDTFGDLYGLAMSRNGAFFFAAGKAKQLIKYVRTKDIVFLEEEEEKEMAKQMELEEDAVDIATSAQPANMDSTLQVATRKTMEAVEAGDALIDLLAAVQPDTELELVGRNVAKFARSVKPNDLHDAMVFLPYVYVKPLVIAFAFALKERVEVELVSKSALVLLQLHGERMGPDCREALEMLQRELRESLWEVRDLFGVNFAGLRELERKANENKMI